MSSLKIHAGVILLMLLSCSVLAQKKEGLGHKLNSSSNRLQGKLIGKVYRITAEANRNFLYPNDWVEGDILLTNGDKYENRKLRYEANEDELIVYNANTFTLFFVEKQLVKSFTFIEENKLHKFVKLSTVGDSAKDRYFEELYSGAHKFLAFYFVFEYKVSPYVDRNGITRDSEFQIQTNYFMYSESHGLQKMDITRRSFFNAFPEKKKEIRKMFRKNHIAVQNEPSMIAAFQLLEKNKIID